MFDCWIPHLQPNQVTCVMVNTSSLKGNPKKVAMKPFVSNHPPIRAIKKTCSNMNILVISCFPIPFVIDHACSYPIHVPIIKIPSGYLTTLWTIAHRNR